MDVQRIVEAKENSIKLIRNSRGYNWEIKINDFNENAILPKIEKIDTELRQKYAPDPEAE